MLKELHKINEHIISIMLMQESLDEEDVNQFDSERYISYGTISEAYMVRLLYHMSLITSSEVVVYFVMDVFGE